MNTSYLNKMNINKKPKNKIFFEWDFKSSIIFKDAKLSPIKDKGKILKVSKTGNLTLYLNLFKKTNLFEYWIIYDKIISNWLMNKKYFFKILISIKSKTLKKIIPKRNQSGIINCLPIIIWINKSLKKIGFISELNSKWNILLIIHIINGHII